MQEGRPKLVVICDKNIDVSKKENEYIIIKTHCMSMVWKILSKKQHALQVIQRAMLRQTMCLTGYMYKGSCLDLDPELSLFTN